MRAAFIVLIVVVFACNKPAPGLEDAAPPEPFPALDDSCAVDDDCTDTPLVGGCCPPCEMRKASNAYVKRAYDYCGRHPPTNCAPQACSFATTPPKCVDRHCR
jgi:hypothetical protein